LDAINRDKLLPIPTSLVLVMSG